MISNLRSLLPLSALVCFCFATLAYADDQPDATNAIPAVKDKSGAFFYTLPEEWETRDIPQFNHDVLFLPRIDDTNRTVIVTDQEGPGPIEVIAKKYERDLPKALKNFKLVSSEIVALKSDSKVAKIVHTNSQPGLPIRQINYIIDLDGKYYFIAYTCLAADGEKFDEMVEAFVTSMMAGN